MAQAEIRDSSGNVVGFIDDSNQAAVQAARDRGFTVHRVGGTGGGQQGGGGTDGGQQGGGGGGTGGGGADQGFGSIEDLQREIFGERPELAFLGQLDQADLPENLEDFFRGRTSDFLQRFQQAMGAQLAAGNEPTLTAQDFFSNIDFEQERFRFSPRERGMGTRRFAPGARFLR